MGPCEISTAKSAMGSSFGSPPEVNTKAIGSPGQASRIEAISCWRNASSTECPMMTASKCSWWSSNKVCSGERGDTTVKPANAKASFRVAKSRGFRLIESRRGMRSTGWAKWRHRQLQRRRIIQRHGPPGRTPGEGGEATQVAVSWRRFPLARLWENNRNYQRQRRMPVACGWKNAKMRHPVAGIRRRLACQNREEPVRSRDRSCDANAWATR